MFFRLSFPLCMNPLRLAALAASPFCVRKRGRVRCPLCPSDISPASGGNPAFPSSSCIPCEHRFACSRPLTLREGDGNGVWALVCYVVWMDQLDMEIAAFERDRIVLEAKHWGKWVVFHDRELVGAYPSLDRAADEALDRFGKDVFLIRQVGRDEVSHVPSVFRVS